MFKDCTIDNLTIILGNKHQQETNNFGDSDECQNSEGDVCDHENDRFVKFDSYDDDQKTEIISLLDELEDIEFFWNRELFQPVWELWVLPEQFGSIYHKIHSPVEVKESANKELVSSLVFNFEAPHDDFLKTLGKFVFDILADKSENIQIEFKNKEGILNVYKPTTETDTEKTNIFENNFSPRIIKGKFISSFSFEYTPQSLISLLNMESPSMWLVERTYDDVVSIYEALGFIAQKAPYHES